ncbi:MAG: hypothetical protein HRT89_07000 [Lentisphaeria bacterium]|nr:cytochrome b562 [Lentisphaeria bacterium]NQZ67801.1 hypothetical protein [Lentisphaeria bacterium]
MKKLLLFTTILFSLVLIPQTYAQVDDEELELSPLEKEMKIADKAYKIIKKGLKKGSTTKNKDLIKAAKDLQGSFKKCKELVPLKIAEMKDAKLKKKMIGEYKKAMDVAIKMTVKLEKALKAKDLKTAEAIRKELFEGKKAGHEKFQKDE